MIHNTIAVLLIDRNARINYGTSDFRPSHAAIDPTHTLYYPFRTSYSPPPPTLVSASTPAPMSRAEARHYPDETLWADAHGPELQ